ncbi:hypothetical protein [Salinispora sp. H7-4]|uniref:hypothetical protein n=1 Tax=Salinispora sp. H7-4 TaxID=2748321 RepID=UPI0021059A6A|nr:hypothetical protein [Salinispora sp. H7-4]
MTETVTYRCSRPFGDAVFGVATALFLLPRPDATRAISLVLAMVALGGVAPVLVGGVLVDRRRRTVMIIISDLIRLAALAAILLADPAAPLPTLLTAALVMDRHLGRQRAACDSRIPSRQQAHPSKDSITDGYTILLCTMWRMTSATALILTTRARHLDHGRAAAAADLV